MEPPTLPRNHHLQTWTEGKLMKLLEEDSFECISQSASFHVSTSWQVPDIQLVFVQEGRTSWNMDVWGMLRTSTFSTFEATFEIFEMWSAPLNVATNCRGALVEFPWISTMKCPCDYDSPSSYHKHQALTVYFLFPYNPFKKNWWLAWLHDSCLGSMTHNSSKDDSCSRWQQKQVQAYYLGFQSSRKDAFQTTTHGAIPKASENKNTSCPVDERLSKWMSRCGHLTGNPTRLYGALWRGTLHDPGTTCNLRKSTFWNFVSFKL